MARANKDPSMQSCKRTCNFPVCRQWQAAKPRTGTSIYFHVVFLGHGEGLSQEPYCASVFGLFGSFFQDY
jgi:hypothetical protein